MQTSSTDSAVAILPINLGAAAAFDQTVFPLAYYEDRGDNLTKGSLLIRATLEEMEKIKQLGIDLNKNEDFILNTILGVEQLKARKAKLQDKRKTLNPFKAFFNYRAARMFHDASRALYLETKRTSEKIHREEERLRVVPIDQMRIVNGAISPDAVLGGWAIELPNGWNGDAQRTIDEAKQTITKRDPFRDDALASQLRDDDEAITLAETASLITQDVHDSVVDEGYRTSVASSNSEPRPTSPSINHIHYNFIQNSILATNSQNLSGFTTNTSQSNGGASINQGPVS